MALTTWDELAYSQARSAAIAANGARNARSFYRIASKGAGEVHIINPVAFDVTFVEEPAFTSGVSIGAGQLQEGAYPIASVGVYKWQIDSRGFWTGAYVWVAVTFAPSGIGLDGELNYQNDAIDQAQRVLTMSQLQLSHHLVFEGMALRDVDFNRIESN